MDISNSATMNLDMWYAEFKYFGYIPRIGIAGSNDSFIFRFGGQVPAVCKSSLFPQFLTSISFCFLDSHSDRQNLKMDLICISLTNKDVDYFSCVY